jgi:hypothetical protein
VEVFSIDWIHSIQNLNALKMPIARVMASIWGNRCSRKGEIKTYGIMVGKP